MNARYDPTLTPMTRLIYTELLFKTCHGTRATRVSDFELAEAFNVSIKCASRCINRLCKSGYLRKEKLLYSRALHIISK